ASDAVPPQAGPRDAGPRGAGTREVGTREVGTREVGTREVGTREVGTREVGTREVGTREVGTRLRGLPDGEPELQRVFLASDFRRQLTLEQHDSGESGLDLERLGGGTLGGGPLRFGLLSHRLQSLAPARKALLLGLAITVRHALQDMQGQFP